MNTPIAAAGCLTLIALGAHSVGAFRQVLLTAPGRLTDRSRENFDVIERNWVMAVCAFQMVAIDLLVLTTLLFLLAFTQLIPQGRLLALALSAFFVLWGLAWAVQLLVFRRKLKDFFILSQWLYWFVCAGLVYWGAQSL
jgi:hypothetical protein